MKKIFVVILVLTMIMSLCACGGGGDNVPGSKSLRLTINGADAGSFAIGTHTFADKVAEYTEGRYTVEVYGGDQLANGSSVTSWEMVQSGNIDFIFGSGLVVSNIDQRMAITSLPWLFDSYEEALDVMAGEGGEAMTKVMEECGFIVLGIGDNGFRNWTSTDKIFYSPDDFKGVKFRVPSVPMYVDLFTMLGADPVAINQSEVYVALQQGAVEGQENPIELCMTWKMFEIQKYLTLCNYSYDPFYLCTSPKFWDSLSDADKEAIRKAAEESCAIQIEARLNSDAENLESAKNDYGVTVHELTEEELELFREAAAPINDQYQALFDDELLEIFVWR